jgi:branched-chain amino acid transport system substrate-binding protein
MPVSNQRNLRRLALLGSAAALALGAAACSGSGGGSADPGTSSAGASGASSGSPILIGSTGPINSSELSQPERKAAEEAAISDLNAKGGIGGHPLKLVFCDTENTANGEVTCMHQLVSDNVSAILCPGIIADESGQGYQLASAAKIPVIGGQGLTPAEFAIPGIFPMGSGIPGWAYGSVAALLDDGAKKIAFFGTTDAGSEYIISLSESALRSAGLQPVRAVAVDQQTDPTFASGAAQVIAGGVGGIIFDSNPVDAPKGVSALRAAGYKGLISSITAIFGPSTLQALGSQANGVLLTSQMAFPSDTSNAGVTAFLADMKKYQAGAEINETAETAWASVMLFADVTKGLPTVDSATVWSAFSNLGKPVNVGIAGPYQVAGAKVYLKASPRIYNPTVQNGVVKNGVLVPNGKGFLNPFTELASHATSS